MPKIFDRLGTTEAWHYMRDLEFSIQSQKITGLTTTIPLTPDYLINAGGADLAPIILNKPVYLFLHKLLITVLPTPFPNMPLQQELQLTMDAMPMNFTFGANVSNVASSAVQSLFNVVRRLYFLTVPSGVTVADVEVYPQLATNMFGYQRLYAGAQAQGASLDLTPWGHGTLGLLFGDPAFAGDRSNGYFQLLGSNTNGSPATVNCIAFGQTLLGSITNSDVAYVDLTTNNHPIGTIVADNQQQNIMINELINSPITNPTPPTFGSLLFTNTFDSFGNATQSVFYNDYYVNIYLSASVVTLD